jgi:hypothetical protein
MGELKGRVLFSDLQATVQVSHPVHLSKSINQPSCGIVVPPLSLSLKFLAYLLEEFFLMKKSTGSN